MLFASLPHVRHHALLEFMRHRVGSLRGATLGQPTLPVQRPSVSRFLVAGICGCLLWQPLISKGEVEVAWQQEPMAVTSPVSPADADRDHR